MFRFSSTYVLCIGFLFLGISKCHPDSETTMASKLEILTEMVNKQQRDIIRLEFLIDNMKKEFDEKCKGTCVKGETGAQGEPGATGSPGAKGETGPPGRRGSSGRRGSQGRVGKKGETGFRGPIGPPGLKGNNGTNGIQGANGPPGVKGDQGPNGVKGDQGPTGAKGDRGLAGSKGDQGPSGAKGDRGPTGLTGPKGSKGDCVVYGIWTKWSQWSGCSVTCKTGTQTRTRRCQKMSSDDLDCQGEDTVSRTCNNGLCPDCTKTCPPDKTLNENCTACTCSSNIRHFRVVNTRMVPIDGATVARFETQYEVLGTTADSNGIKIDNLCEADVLIFKMSKYMDATVTLGAVTEDPIRVVMQTIESVEVVSHPQDTVALIGDSVNFTCRAIGKPLPNAYQWFKNDKPISPDSSIFGKQLTLENLGDADKGSYRCKASSEYSSAMSNTAYLDVKDDGDIFCDPVPLSHRKRLPKDCPQAGDNPLSYEVGRCPRNECIRRPKANDEAEYCCGPTNQTTRNITCVDYTLDIVVTLGCGCILCNQVNNTGNMITTRRKVTFSGYAHDIIDRNFPLRFGEVYLFDEKVTTTDFSGEFNFPVPIDMTRIVVSFKEGFIKNNFIETSKVFNIPKGYSGSFYRDIPLLRKSTVVEISSSATNTLSMANSTSNQSFAELIIPGDSFYKSDGSKYNGPVQTAINFIDPRNSDELDAMVGDLTFIDDDGDIGSLQTFGMFHLAFNDMTGNDLSIKGEVGMAISADAIGAGLQNETNVKLWSFNPSSARWEYEGNLKPVSKTRKKRSQSYYSSNFFVGDTVITDRYWFNFDTYYLNFCFVKMKTYSDSTLHTSKLLNWDRSFEPTVIALDQTSWQAGSAGRIVTGSMSYNGKTGVSSDEDCILSVCGDSVFHGYLLMDTPTGALSASTDLGGLSPTLSGVNITVDQLGSTTSRNRVIETTVSPITSNGPVYHSNTSLCYNESSPFCVSCTSTWWPRPHPECILCDSGKCTYPNTLAYTMCMKANDTDPHYSFYPSMDPLYEFSVCEILSRDCQMLPNLHPQSWFPQVTSQYWVWFIKIRVVVSWTSDESSVRVVSRGGSHPDTLGKMFGIREDRTIDQSACVEFKGSGGIITESGPASDQSIVEISVEGTDCSVDSVASNLQQYQINTTYSNVSIVSFQPPSSLISGLNFGIYGDDNIDLQAAKATAKSRCLCGDFQQGRVCNSPVPMTGVAVTIICRRR